MACAPAQPPGPQAAAAALRLPREVLQARMRRALFLAESHLGLTAPNPSVGCVVVHADSGEILASAVTARGGRPHAETQALKDAGEAARGAVLFVTLEPCSHVGVTPPCAEAIVAAGIGAVVYGSLDPDPRVAGRGLQHLNAHGILTHAGAFRDESDWIVLGHALRVTQRRPFVQVKLGVDANGRVPQGVGAPVFVSGAHARSFGHLLRAKSDAILIGRGTVDADDPELTCRLPGLEDRSPIRIVLSASGALPSAARLSNSKAPPVWVVCADASAYAALEGQGVRVFEAGRSAAGSVDLHVALARLAEAGITRLLVEGGPTTARGFFDAGLADEVIIFKSDAALNPDASLPALGPGHLDLAARGGAYILFERRRLGSDTVSIYRSNAHWRG